MLEVFLNAQLACRIQRLLQGLCCRNFIRHDQVLEAKLHHIEKPVENVVRNLQSGGKLLILNQVLAILLRIVKVCVELTCFDRTLSILSQDSNKEGTVAH